MRIRLSRQNRFEVAIRQPREPNAVARGFCFEGVLTIEAPIDPLSGMTVNLVEIDRWWREILAGLDREFPDEEELLCFLYSGLRDRVPTRVTDCVVELKRAGLRLERSGAGNVLSLRWRGFVTENKVPHERGREVRLAFPDGQLAMATGLAGGQAQAWENDIDGPELPGPDFAWLETREIHPITGEQTAFISKTSD